MHAGAGEGGVREVGQERGGREVRGPEGQDGPQGREPHGRDAARLRQAVRVRRHLRRRLPAGAGFLVDTVPLLLRDPGLALVQTRWDYGMYVSRVANPDVPVIYNTAGSLFMSALSRYTH